MNNNDRQPDSDTPSGVKNQNKDQSFSCPACQRTFKTEDDANNHNCIEDVDPSRPQTWPTANELPKFQDVPCVYDDAYGPPQPGQPRNTVLAVEVPSNSEPTATTDEKPGGGAKAAMEGRKAARERKKAAREGKTAAKAKKRMKEKKRAKEGAKPARDVQTAQKRQEEQMQPGVPGSSNVKAPVDNVQSASKEWSLQTSSNRPLPVFKDYPSVYDEAYGPDDPAQPRATVLAVEDEGWSTPTTSTAEKTRGLKVQDVPSIYDQAYGPPEPGQPRLMVLATVEGAYEETAPPVEKPRRQKFQDVPSVYDDAYGPPQPGQPRNTVLAVEVPSNSEPTASTEEKPLRKTFKDVESVYDQAYGPPAPGCPRTTVLAIETSEPESSAQSPNPIHEEKNRPVGDVCSTPPVKGLPEREEIKEDQNASHKSDNDVVVEIGTTESPEATQGGSCCNCACLLRVLSVIAGIVIVPFLALAAIVILPLHVTQHEIGKLEKNKCYCLKVFGIVLLTALCIPLASPATFILGIPWGISFWYCEVHERYFVHLLSDG